MPRVNHYLSKITLFSIFSMLLLCFWYLLLLGPFNFKVLLHTYTQKTTSAYTTGHWTSLLFLTGFGRVRVTSLSMEDILQYSNLSFPLFSMDFSQEIKIKQNAVWHLNVLFCVVLFHLFFCRFALSMTKMCNDGKRLELRRASPDRPCCCTPSPVMCHSRENVV